MSILKVQQISLKHQLHVLLNQISFEVNPNEHWLLVGPSGSGKTVLLNAIAGKLPPTAGSIVLAPAVKHHVTLVTSKHQFKDKTNTSTNLYYQQRYNSTDADQSVTVTQYLESKATTASQDAHWTIERVSTLFNLGPLLDKELIKLSNGETKRLRLATALLAQPKLLLLDDPLSGLDQQTQQQFDTILYEIISAGVTLIMSGSGHEVPAAITHVAILQQGSLLNVVPASAYHPGNLPSLPLLSTSAIQALVSKAAQTYEHVVDMHNVTIRYDELTILNGVNWQIKPGERWALFGHNGAGKSTLLSLINGDNPQAYANHIVLFDKKRGTGESIWDIKRHIGFLSPELYQYFPADQTALQVVESGFYDTQGLFRPSNPAKLTRAAQWLNALGIERYSNQMLKNLPASAQRLCLLARAVIKNPALLILDEPCQGLDQEQRRQINAVIDTITKATDVTLIYVTHYMTDLPACITHTLQLQQGQVVTNKTSM